MKSKYNDVFLILAIVFAIVGGILIAYSFSQPIVYEKDVADFDNQINQEITTIQQEFQKPVSYPLNINTATVEELMTIPNVGQSKAYAIVDYRNEIGGYSSVEQIMDIYGFGETTYYEIAGYLTV